MRTCGLCVALALAALLAACGGPSTEMSDLERDALCDTITQRMDAYLGELATLDPERVAPFYAEGFRYYPDSLSVGRDSLLVLIRGLGQEFRRYDVTNDTVEVTPLSRDAVLAAAKFHTLRTDTLGVDSRVKGTVTWVWVRFGDQWLLIHGQSIHLPDTAH